MWMANIAFTEHKLSPLLVKEALDKRFHAAPPLILIKALGDMNEDVSSSTRIEV